MARSDSRTNPTNVNTAGGGRMTRTALRRVYAQAEPLTQLDFFIDRNGVADIALEQLHHADRMAEEAGIKLRPLVRKRT